MEEEKVESEVLPEQEEAIWEESPYNQFDRYHPTVYEIIGYKKSWKQCHCGRRTLLKDNWCPSCGQRLGMPENYGKEGSN